MFKFRGQQKGNGGWIEGWYIQTRAHVLDDNDIDDYPVNHLIVDEFMNEYDVYPHTLSISTGKPDSKGEEIFASFPIDGVMTEGGGGDVVEVKGLEGEKYGIRYSPYIYSFTMHRINSEFDLTCHISNIDSQDITIIGKQGGGNEIRQN